MKSEEAYPKSKIEEIDKLIIAEKLKKQQEAELLERYKAAIDKGDQEFQAGNYKNALSQFNDAIAIKPNEAYPKSKVVDIQGILEDQRRKAEAEGNKMLEEEKRMQFH